jgi:2-polyprenyl-6-methoxyphenol hydroxylase-like FAD-dependent oxidoreductase
MEKLDKIYKRGNIPVYSKDEANKLAQEVSAMPLRRDLTFGDLWKDVGGYNLVALEEGIFKLWTWGRIACLGDSIHKMTINIGSGGNTAIESAAAFANSVVAIAKEAEKTPISNERIAVHLQRYQQRREKRAAAITEMSAAVTRLQALDGPLLQFVASYCLPLLGDTIADGFCDYMVDAEILVS